MVPGGKNRSSQSADVLPGLIGMDFLIFLGFDARLELGADRPLTWAARPKSE